MDADMVATGIYMLISLTAHGRISTFGQFAGLC